MRAKCSECGGVTYSDLHDMIEDEWTCPDCGGIMSMDISDNDVERIWKEGMFLLMSCQQTDGLRKLMAYIANELD